MRYQDVCTRLEQLLVARSECSREWAISDSVVMWVEFDIAAAVRISLAIPGHTEPRHMTRTPRLVKVMFFDLGGLRVLRESMTTTEQLRIDVLQRSIDGWVSGECEALPPSTSSVISERFHTR